MTLVTGFPSSMLLGQERAPAGPSDTRANPTVKQPQPAVQEIGTIISAKDKEGNLVHLPNLPYEDIVKILQERGAEAESGPAYHFTAKREVSGRVTAGRAELNLDYEVEVHRPGWVEIPLRLPNAHPQKSTFQGRGKHDLIYDEAKGGYVMRIRADEADSLHRVTLSVIAPVSGTERERTLAVRLPEGIPSKLTFTTSVPKAEARVGAGCELLETKHEGKNSTFLISQRDGDVVLTWTAPGQRASRPNVFEADGEILVRWTAARVSWDAKFAINVRQGELSQLRVRLPREARLSSSQEFPAHSIESEVVDERTKVSEVTIKLDQTVREGSPREVRILCERALDENNTGGGDPVEVGRFEVLGAARQTGVLGIATSTDLRPILTKGNDWLPELQTPQAFREGGVRPENVHRYLSPETMRVTVAQRRSLVTVAPTHLLLAGSEQVKLESRLNYRLVGTLRSRCRINMPGWTVDQIELIEGDAVRAIGFEPFQTEPLEVNLPNNISDDFELRIVAHQSRQPDAQKLELTMPEVAADEPLRARVILQPDDNISVAFVPDDSIGLQPSQLDPDIVLPRREQRPLMYATVADGEAKLVATSQTRPQEIMVHHDGAMVELGRSRARLTQSLKLSVSSAPLNGIVLEAPGQGHDLRLLDLVINGESSTFKWHSDEDMTRIEVPGLFQGVFDIRAAAEISYPLLESDEVTAIEFPLFHVSAIPTAASGTPVQLNVAADIQAVIEGKSHKAGNATDGDHNEIHIAAVPTSSVLKVTASAVRPRKHNAPIVVEKAWLQTWVSNAARQDRAVFQLRANRPNISLDVPKSADLARLILLVNGKDQSPQFDGERRLRVELPADDVNERQSRRFETTQHVIECWWPSIDGEVHRKVAYSPPTVVGAWTKRLYWHVVVPKNRLAMVPPAGFEEEMVASDWWWSRRPRVPQASLERWCGASPQSSPAAADHADGYSEYLFSSLGAPADSSLTIVSSTTPMALAGLGVLAIGLALYYLRAARHPLVLGIAVVVVMYLGFAWPALAILVGKAVILAVGLALGVKVMEQLLMRGNAIRRRQTSGRMRETSPSHRPRRDAVPSVLAPSPSTTATAAASIPVSPSDAT